MGVMVLLGLVVSSVASLFYSLFLSFSFFCSLSLSFPSFWTLSLRFSVSGVLILRPLEELAQELTGIDPTSSAAQNSDAHGGAGQRTGKESTSRRKEDAKQAAKKPKEKADALSQFDLNNYASEFLQVWSPAPLEVVCFSDPLALCVLR